MLADSHIHLSHPSFDHTFPYLDQTEAGFVLRESGTRETLIRQMQQAGIRFCIEPAIDLLSNERILALAKAWPGFLYPAAGIHPTRTWTSRQSSAPAEKLRWRDRKRLRMYAQDPTVIAIGETGLDYHLQRSEQHRLRQMLWFVWQLQLAHRQKLPVILHIRDADRDALRILRLFQSRLHGGVCHCFQGGAALARAYTELGLALGIGGALLQPESCAELEDAIRVTPLRLLLLETDGPYVKPVCPLLSGKQRRKARNTSLILPAVAARIGELKGISPQEVERVTAENAARIFHIPLKDGGAASPDAPDTCPKETLRS